MTFLSPGTHPWLDVTCVPGAASKDTPPCNKRSTPRPALLAPPSMASSSSGSELLNGLASSERDIGLRSFRGVAGLQMAENGQAMIEFDICGDSLGMGSRFLSGNRFVLDPMTPGGSTHSGRTTIAASGSRLSKMPPSQFSDTSSPSGGPPFDPQKFQAHGSEEFRLLLGHSNARLKRGTVNLSSPANGTLLVSKRRRDQHQTVSLEQAKPRSRVEVDVVLESDTLVQGGYVRGHIKVHVRKRVKKEAPVQLAEGKLRIVGFESVPNDNVVHTFYQCAAPLSAITDASRSLYGAPMGEDGFTQAIEGIHILPFAMELPSDSCFGDPKGVMGFHSGATVRYVAMVSFKVRDSKAGKWSIAHFYRDCEVWPRLDPCRVLTPAPRPLQASSAKGLFVLPPLGNCHEHKVKLAAQLHRLSWVAGQRCHVKIFVQNDSRWTVKSCVLALIRTTTVFRLAPASDACDRDASAVDLDACQTSTQHKVVAESLLEMGHNGAKGYASAKGWWKGVKPGQEFEFSHFLLLPTDAVSITRGRLLEVEYSIRVTVAAGPLVSDVSVTLPIRVINFISIDPPPSAALLSANGAYFRSVQHYPSRCPPNIRDQWRDFSDYHETRGVMHTRDDSPPLVTHPKFTGTATQPQTTTASTVNTGLHVTNSNTEPDRANLSHAVSEVSVYSTDSARLDLFPPISRECGGVEAGSNRRAASSAISPAGLDDFSEVDAMLRSVVENAKQNGGEGGEKRGTFDICDLAHQHNPTTPPSYQRSCNDPEKTPRVGSGPPAHHRHLFDPPILPSTGCCPEKPPIPPRSAKRPRSVHIKIEPGRDAKSYLHSCDL